MALYRLKFAEDGIGSAKAVEFHADDASTALLISQNESPTEPPSYGAMASFYAQFAGMVSRPISGM